MHKLFNTYNFTNFSITKGNGSYLFDNKGKKYLDFSAGVAVNALGYNHSVFKTRGMHASPTRRRMLVVVCSTSYGVAKKA